MVAAVVTKMWAANDPYSNDGLGTSTPLGCGYLRAITIAMNDDVNIALTAADFGFTFLYGPLSIFGSDASNTGYYISTISNAGMTVNAPQASTVSVIALGRGI